MIIHNEETQHATGTSFNSRDEFYKDLDLLKKSL
jgi:hypothetical protein